MELEFEEIYSKFEIKSNICSEISDILDSCKRTKSWNNQSYLHINEYTNGKFNIYEKFKTIEDIYDTTEIDFTDLIIVRDGLLEYLKKHIEMDKNIKNLHIYWTDQMRYNEIFEYIEIRPGITIEELNECTEFGIDIIINIVLDLYQKNKITTLNESDLPIQKETINKISLCKNYNKY